MRECVLFGQILKSVLNIWDFTGSCGGHISSLPLCKAACSGEPGWQVWAGSGEELTSLGGPPSLGGG